MTELTITINLGPHWSESCSSELGLDEPQSEWVALDFETATASRASACALGLAHIADKRVIVLERVLIQPPGNEYDGFNVMIHGIGPEMTADSPTFAEIWPRICDRLAGKPVVAHNASFDFSVLRHSLDAAGVDYPELSYYCTRVFALRHWPDLPSYATGDHAPVGRGQSVTSDPSAVTLTRPTPSSRRTLSSQVRWRACSAKRRCNAFSTPAADLRPG
jgi:DNA polymerase III epsilon subunit-like protein